MSSSSPLPHVLYVSPGSLSEYSVHAMRYVVRVRSTPTMQTKANMIQYDTIRYNIIYSVIQYDTILKKIVQ